MVILQSLVTVNVIYYLPDYSHILNEFIWQTNDVVPNIPRVHRFLNYWKSDIDAVIKEVLMTHTYQRDWKKVDIDWRI